VIDKRAARQEARAMGKKKKKKAAAGALVDDDGPGAPPANLEAWAERERNQHRALMGVEDSMKRLWHFLEEQKIADDTIIFYSGDNGFFHGEHGLHGKLEPYEESIRVPMMVRYPRLIPAGQTCEAMVANVDMAPSILDLCGFKAPLPMQGKSWRPLVTGKGAKAPLRDSFVYSLHRGDPALPAAKALRTDRYKLILNLNPHDKEELYDLKTDPQEMTNLALDNQHKEVVAEMKRTLLFQMKQIEDPAIPAVEATMKK
jgi:arylsulfatase A-like enzyme